MAAQAFWAELSWQACIGLVFFFEKCFSESSGPKAAQETAERTWALLNWVAFVFETLTLGRHLGWADTLVGSLGL
jgi:hypothetical protein